MELFRPDQMYTSKEVQKKVNISRGTLDKYCKSGLMFTTLPDSQTRRFIGRELNVFFKM